MNIDPLAEDFSECSPYVYAFNDPLRHVDPDGNAPEDVIDTDPPVKKSSSLGNINLNLKVPVKQYQGYVGESLDMVITSGIQWVGEQLTGSEVSKETSENIQLITNIATVIVSKGKNVKADTELAEQITKTETKAVSSNAARREVMRKEGIPTSQQPKSQSKNASGREYTYETAKKGGGKETKSVQQQTMDSSHQGQPHWEAGKVKTNNGEVRTNNYGRAKLQNDKSKVNY